MSGAHASAADFEPHRRYLRGLAYRMLASRAEAEDVVQDAWLRWRVVDHAEVDNPRAFLARTVTHLCLDRLKSAQAQREVYIGEWLPEPVVDDETQFHPGPEAAHELASDLSFAFMLTLEKLSPLERAAFLLHDVFDTEFSDIASALGRSESACRQLASRARSKLRAERPRFKVSENESTRLAQAFANALRDGDVAALASVLAQDARFVSDGGGRVTAVPKALTGRDVVAKVVIGFSRLYDPANYRLRHATVNGMAGFVLSTLSGELVQTIALEADESGQIGAIYVMRNPDKLRLVAP